MNNLHTALPAAKAMCAWLYSNSRQPHSLRPPLCLLHQLTLHKVQCILKSLLQDLMLVSFPADSYKREFGRIK